MEATLGQDWAKLFDIKLTKCEKPLFYKSNNPFYECLKEGKKGKKIEKAEELQDSLSNVFGKGNAKTLIEYFQYEFRKENISIALFGS